MLERGRLYSLRKDGTKDSLYLNIKNKRFLFGSSEYCTVRIYMDGIFPEHCVMTIGGQGKAYLEPLHPSALIFVNGIKIQHRVCLKDGDVVRILIKEFQFAYPPNSLTRDMSFDMLVLPYSKQIKPIQKFEKLTLRKNLESYSPFRESNIPNINHIPKNHICVIQNDILKKDPEYLLKFMHQEAVNILYEKLNVQEINSSCSDKTLIKYMNHYVKESLEGRINLALKLYEFISFLRKLLNKNDTYLYDVWPLLECIWKFCHDRANEDILFLPLKSFNLKGEITIHKKSLQSRISCTSKNVSPVSNMMTETENDCIKSLEVIVSSNCKKDGQKQNQYPSRKMSISYKKRVSLAVKRYHLRKRKSVMMSKTAEIGSVENLELSGERPQMKDTYREVNSDEQDVILNLEKQQTTVRKRKRCYNKKKKEELQDKGKKLELQDTEDSKIKQEISIKVVKDHIGKLNSTSEPKKEKQRNKKAVSMKTDLNPGKENIAELSDNSSRIQVTTPTLIGKKQSKEKQISKIIGLKQESEKESIENTAGEQTTDTRLTETKVTKRCYKRKKKEAVPKTALKDEMETKFTHRSPMKENTSETNELKSKKRNYKKKKEVSLEKTDSCKSTQECDPQKLSQYQRITRSMAKSRL